MIYDGVVAHLLGIDLDEMRKALLKQFGPGKAKAAEMNWGAVDAGKSTPRENLTKTDPYAVERMNATAGKIIIDGNSAAALGCVFAGVTVLTWYPITPSSSLAEALMGLPRAVPHRPGNAARRRTRSCRPKTNWRRSAWPSAPVGRARGR